MLPPLQALLALSFPHLPNDLEVRLRFSKSFVIANHKFHLFFELGLDGLVDVQRR